MTFGDIDSSTANYTPDSQALVQVVSLIQLYYYLMDCLIFDSWSSYTTLYKQAQNLTTN